jgi:hypothetical protein
VEEPVWINASWKFFSDRQEKQDWKKDLLVDSL